jgi:hypothetical protein
MAQGAARGREMSVGRGWWRLSLVLTYLTPLLLDASTVLPSSSITTQGRLLPCVSLSSRPLLSGAFVGQTSALTVRRVNRHELRR